MIGLTSPLDTEDVNKALVKLGHQLDQKLQDTTEEQKVINEVLCQETCLARYQWQSGSLGKEMLVPWESQCANSCPENFECEESVVTC